MTEKAQLGGLVKFILAFAVVLIVGKFFLGLVGTFIKKESPYEANLEAVISDVRDMNIDSCLETQFPQVLTDEKDYRILISSEKKNVCVFVEKKQVLCKPLPEEVKINTQVRSPLINAEQRSLKVCRKEDSIMFG